MSESGQQKLILAPDGGWLCDGRHWGPHEPFYAVVGDPKQSATVAMAYRAGIHERALTAEILTALVENGELRRIKRGGSASLLAGFHVVGSLQKGVSKLCDGRTEVSHETGIVNVVRIQDELWMGHDIQSGSIQAVLTQAWPGEMVPVQAEILGVGDSTRAAVWALFRWGVRSLTIRDHSGREKTTLQSWLSRTERV